MRFIAKPITEDGGFPQHLLKSRDEKRGNSYLLDEIFNVFPRSMERDDRFTNHRIVRRLDVDKKDDRGAAIMRECVGAPTD